MEAAIWTANKVAELIAADKLGKSVSLNVDYKPYELMVQASRALAPLQAALPAYLGFRFLKKKIWARKEA